MQEHSAERHAHAAQVKNKPRQLAKDADFPSPGRVSAVDADFDLLAIFIQTKVQTERVTRTMIENVFSHFSTKTFVFPSHFWISDLDLKLSGSHFWISLKVKSRFVLTFDKSQQYGNPP